MSKVEKEMPIEKAFEVARKYCDENGYDFDSIKELIIIRNTYGPDGQETAFCLPGREEYIPGAGLTMDLATQPRCVLLVAGDYTIETTSLIEQFRK